MYEAAGRMESVRTDAGFHRRHDGFEVHYSIWRERCPRDINNGNIRIPRKRPRWKMRTFEVSGKSHGNPREN